MRAAPEERSGIAWARLSDGSVEQPLFLFVVQTAPVGTALLLLCRAPITVFVQ